MEKIIRRTRKKTKWDNNEKIYSGRNDKKNKKEEYVQKEEKLRKSKGQENTISWSLKRKYENKTLK